MKINYFLMLIVILFPFTSSYAQDRDFFIGQELDCVSQRLTSSGEVGWADVCSIVPKDQVVFVALDRIESQRVLQSVSEDEFIEEIDIRVKESILKIDSNLSVDIGIESSYIRYEEPNFIEEKGYMYGVFGSVTYNEKKNRTLQDVFSQDSWPDVYRLDGKFSWGYVDYSAINGVDFKDLRDYMIEVRGVAGYDIGFTDEIGIMPYVGLGYRYLNNDLVSDQPGGYIREANYYYVPIGIETKVQWQRDLSTTAILEYDHFIKGRQLSHLENSTSYDTLTNGQGKGYGLRGSLKLVKESSSVDFYFEPFVRYWNIEDSEVEPITSGGVVTGFVGLEPANISREYGFKLGANF